MLTGIDHIVILVRDLAAASAEHAKLGFTVTPGGAHRHGATHNALISFADGTYFELIAFVMVGLHSQSEADLRAFENRVLAWPLVRECYIIAGETDFIMKCVAPDLTAFQDFIIQDLTSAPNVAGVKTTLVIRRVKSEPGVPITVAQGRRPMRS